MDAIQILFEPYRRVAAARFPFLRSFQRKIKIDFVRGNYRVKTVERSDELERALALRYEVFCREYQRKWVPVGLDVEPFDQIADHLIIEDLKTRRTVGTYRLLSSAFTTKFYSQSEFYLNGFLAEPGEKLELSRACVAREFRTGAVMSLLWRGVSEYQTAVGAKYLFGCSSVKTESLACARELGLEFDRREAVLSTWSVEPVLSYRLPGFRAPARERGLAEAAVARAMVPPLLAMYLRMGAKVAKEPAWDREFHCLDFFTVLNLEKLETGFERRYRKECESPSE